MSTKSELPTHGRLRQARREGRISKSKDLSQALSGCIWVGILAFLFWPAFGAAMRMLIDLLDLIGQPALSLDQLLTLVAAKLLPVPLMIFALVTMGVTIMIVVEQLQVRGVMSAKQVTPDLKRLNPLNQLKNIFSMRTIVDLIKNMIKICIIMTTTNIVIRHYFPDAAKLGRVELLYSGVLAARMLLVISAVSLVSLLLMAFIDIFYQKYEYIKGLKMTKDEVKRDHKQQEGDPLIKGRRRQLHAEITSS